MCPNIPKKRLKKIYQHMLRTHVFGVHWTLFQAKMCQKKLKKNSKICKSDTKITCKKNKVKNDHKKKKETKKKKSNGGVLDTETKFKNKKSSVLNVTKYVCSKLRWQTKQSDKKNQKQENKNINKKSCK